MIDLRNSTRNLASALVFALSAPGAGSGYAAEVGIAYLSLADDPRYLESRLEERYRGQVTGRPLDGAKVALRESRFLGQAVGIEFELQVAEAASEDQLAASLQTLHAAGASFILLDLPADALATLAASSRDLALSLFNVSAPQDRLRNEHCEAHLFHTLPSTAMLTDALAQYLVSRKWRELLLLRGPTPADTELSDSFKRSAKRFGLDIDEEREFLLSNDPRQRNLSNVSLLSARSDYDVVFVADSDGEFARAVPFRTNRPRPVVGAEGLVAEAWHWGWERHGAPQLNSRFFKRAKRDMGSSDWAAWVAVKAVVEASVRSGGADHKAIDAYLRSSELVIDGFKGNPINFRPWSGQLRQPILLSTHNWVVARAPIEGFLHASNKLDSLGYDQRDSACERRR